VNVFVCRYVPAREEGGGRGEEGGERRDEGDGGGVVCGCVCLLLYQVSCDVIVILFLGQYATVQAVSTYLGLSICF